MVEKHVGSRAQFLIKLFWIVIGNYVETSITITTQAPFLLIIFNVNNAFFFIPPANFFLVIYWCLSLNLSTFRETVLSHLKIKMLKKLAYQHRIDVSCFSMQNFRPCSSDMAGSKTRIEESSQHKNRKFPLIFASSWSR